MVNKSDGPPSDLSVGKKQIFNNQCSILKKFDGHPSDLLTSKKTNIQ